MTPSEMSSESLDRHATAAKSGAQSVVVYVPLSAPRNRIVPTAE